MCCHDIVDAMRHGKVWVLVKHSEVEAFVELSSTSKLNKYVSIAVCGLSITRPALRPDDRRAHVCFSLKTIYFVTYMDTTSNMS